MRESRDVRCGLASGNMTGERPGISKDRRYEVEGLARDVEGFVFVEEASAGACRTPRR